MTSCIDKAHVDKGLVFVAVCPYCGPWIRMTRVRETGDIHVTDMFLDELQCPKKGCKHVLIIISESIWNEAIALMEELGTDIGLVRAGMDTVSVKLTALEGIHAEVAREFALANMHMDPWHRRL